MGRFLHSTAPPVHHGSAALAELGQVIFASQHHNRRGDRELGIGSDYDGISALPKGKEDVSGYPALLVELMRRGWSREDIAKVAGLNILRVMREVEAVAAQLRCHVPHRCIVNGRVPIPPCGFGRGVLKSHGNEPRQVDRDWLGAGNK